MSERRWHPFLAEWVVTATHRQDRTFFPPDEHCPLCPTANQSYPTEIPVASFEVVVFENKFPTFETPPPKPSLVGSAMPLTAPSNGCCEVVVYSQRHDATLSSLSLNEVTKLCHVWQDRYVDLSARAGIEYVYIFENKGREIGVTLSHPHGQIYGYPFVPKTIHTRFEQERQHYETHGKLLAESWIEVESSDARRIVWESDRWLLVVPYFARFPYELQLVSKLPHSSLSSMTSADLKAMARGILIAVRKLDQLFGFSMPYIMSLFQSESKHTRFTIEWLPPYRTADKLKYLAASEAVCGVYINDTLPDETARVLREIQPQAI